ncbi:hypothetical protein GS597_07470 [Synechococcales cyanobacterium C]|uniref:Rho termination factor N-terminal domain-containing protein n=1 Tax=Petrachloros mirabilis ULC683 TaxID=2781853 RepID=A0A8K2A6Z4_9CYAN|nr:SAP domain-containing protein [Petrachloros mirabilis]NCJ06351.1 hypothetical protein [Petrachloros mirabilis ULC683]
MPATCTGVIAFGYDTAECFYAHYEVWMAATTPPMPEIVDGGLILPPVKIAGLLMPWDVFGGDAPLPACGTFAPAVPPGSPKENLAALTVKELRRRCKATGIAYRGKDRKADLIAKLA